MGRVLGLPVAQSPAALAEKTEVIFLNLFDSAAVRAVLQGQSGLLAGDMRGKLVIDTTTNHFNDVADFHNRVSSHNGSYLKAPVLSREVPASQGKLTVLASGEKEVKYRIIQSGRKIMRTLRKIRA